MTTTSAMAQIALAVKATLDGYNITRVIQLPTIRSVKKPHNGTVQHGGSSEKQPDGQKVLSKHK
jgi:hypothetical protein